MLAVEHIDTVLLVSWQIWMKKGILPRRSSANLVLLNSKSKRSLPCMSLDDTRKDHPNKKIHQLCNQCLTDVHGRFREENLETASTAAHNPESPFSSSEIL